MFDAEVGPGLAAEIAPADLASLDDAGALALVVAAQRLAGWAAAVRLSAATAFAGKRPVRSDGNDHPDVGGCSWWAIDELATALAGTRGQARDHVARGQLLCEHLPATRELLASGQITEYKAILVLEQATLLDDAGKTRLDERMATRLVDKTTTQIRRAAARAVQAIDPSAAVRRRARAHKDRGVWFTPQPETGMTQLTAILPAADASLLEQRLRHLAETAKTPGDTRTLAARMADVLVDLSLLNPHTRHPDVCRHDQPAAHSGPAGTDSAATTDTQPTTSAVGTRTDTAATTDTGRSTDSRTTSGAGEAEETEDGAGYAHADEPASKGDRDEHGWRDGDGADLPGTGCQHAVDTPTVIHVTVSADTLLGQGHEPAHLAGYGPIDAALARRLAHDHNATWRRILTDPVTGAVLDVGHTSYRPPADLHRHVRTRDRSCRFPGCLRDASRCQQDHTIPYARGGRTAAHTLGELCTHHHRLKHHAGWQLYQPSPGTFEWTTPTGARHTVRPGD